MEQNNHKSQSVLSEEKEILKEEKEILKEVKKERRSIKSLARNVWAMNILILVVVAGICGTIVYWTTANGQVSTDRALVSAPRKRHQRSLDLKKPFSFEKKNACEKERIKNIILREISLSL